MTVLLLVRHGLTDQTGTRLYGRSPGVHLSERGREHAARLAERLAPVRLHALYSSPLERCTETAEPLAAATGRAVQLLPEIQEIDYGRWTGRPFASLRRTKLWAAVRSLPSTARFPDGEALLEVQSRTVRALDEMAARHPRDNVAVAHGDVISLAVAHYLGMHIDLFQRLTVAPGSVSVVALGDGPPAVVRVGDTGSFELPGRRARGGSRK
jgi:probable phosphoglycerate mutase